MKSNTRKDLTPQERLILLSLDQRSPQTAEQLAASVGAKAASYFRRTLHLLVFRDLISSDTAGGTEQYTSVGSANKVVNQFLFNGESQ